jgi:hypothetical protein
MKQRIAGRMPDGKINCLLATLLGKEDARGE